MQCTPSEKKMKSASGNKRTNANVSVSRGKYPVFDLLHSLQSMGDQCTNAPTSARKKVSQKYDLKSEEETYFL